MGGHVRTDLIAPCCRCYGNGRLESWHSHHCSSTRTRRMRWSIVVGCPWCSCSWAASSIPSSSAVRGNVSQTPMHCSSGCLSGDCGSVFGEALWHVAQECENEMTNSSWSMAFLSRPFLSAQAVMWTLIKRAAIRQRRFPKLINIEEF